MALAAALVAGAACRDRPTPPAPAVHAPLVAASSLDATPVRAVPPDAAATSARPERPAEVEITGTLSAPAGLAPAKTRVYASREPCEPPRLIYTLYGSVDVAYPTNRSFFLEIFVPQGTTAHICASAIDAGGRTIGIASYAKNPVTLRGQGEVAVNGVQLDLAPLRNTPAPARKR